MADHVVDTNVLLVASHADVGSKWRDSGQVPASQRTLVFEWLKAFRGDGERLMVMDLQRKIFAEYKNKLTTQDYGLQAVMEKISRGKTAFVRVEYDGDGWGVVPDGLAKFDNSDKKMIAAHLRHKEDGNPCTIVNACDTDWHEHEEMLKAHEVEVEHLLPEWARDEYYRTHPDKAPKGWVARDWTKGDPAKKGVPAPRKGK